MQTLFNIPTPCGENWDKMTPTACGRFCNVCQKEVIDITHLTDEAVTQKLEERGGQMCIHAKATQVIAGRVFPRRRLALFALALWAVFSGGLIEEIYGQDTLQTVQTDTTQYGMVRIKVVDVDDKQPADSAKVLIRSIGLEKDTTYFKCFTDSSGMVTIPQIKRGRYRLIIIAAPKLMRKFFVEMIVDLPVNEFYFEVITDKKIKDADLITGAVGVSTDGNTSFPHVINFSRRYPTREFHPDLHR